MTTESEFENLAVLVVDDNVFVRDLLKRLLRGFGITAVREAENGVTALEFLSGARVDLVICDIQMDGMGGIEFLRMLRSGRKRAGGGEVTTSPSVPVILVTAHAEASVID